MVGDILSSTILLMDLADPNKQFSVSLDFKERSFIEYLIDSNTIKDIMK